MSKFSKIIENGKIVKYRQIVKIDSWTRTKRDKAAQPDQATHENFWGTSKDDGEHENNANPQWDGSRDINLHKTWLHATVLNLNFKSWF